MAGRSGRGPSVRPSVLALRRDNAIADQVMIAKAKLRRKLDCCITSNSEAGGRDRPADMHVTQQPLSTERHAMGAPRQQSVPPGSGAVLLRGPHGPNGVQPPSDPSHHSHDDDDMRL